MKKNMTIVEIRNKLHHYIDTAPEKKVKAIFTLVEDEIDETLINWEDEKFVEELKNREANYLTGKNKGYTIAQSIANAKEDLDATQYILSKPAYAKELNDRINKYNKSSKIEK